MRNEFPAVYRRNPGPRPSAGPATGPGQARPGPRRRVQAPPQRPTCEDEVARLRADVLGFRRPCPRPAAPAWILPAIIGGSLTWALLLTSLG